MKAYLELEGVFARRAAIEDAVAMLEWDAETLLPSGALGGRSDQLAALKLTSREILATERTAILLAEAAAAQDGLSDWQKANLREMRRRHTSAVAVPADLLEAATRAATTCQHVWRDARRDSNFKAVQAQLAEVLRTQREIGQALGDALGLAPYDALLDRYDPGATSSAVDRVFRPLAQILPKLIGDAIERQRKGGDAIAPDGPFAKEAQEKLCRTALEAVGFDFDRGRLDVSTHPFTGGTFDDVRITTRYDESDFLSSLFAVIHEGGHALYEQGRPRQWHAQPVGESAGMSLHESQSLIVEMQAGRSAEFFRFLAPLARDAFGGSGPAWRPDNLRRAATKVEPGLIRVDADEVTYPAHIILRYELETAMIAGDLQLDDLPSAFSARVKDLLGLDVPDHRRGCLQDIHWYGGAWGYFPTYLIGAMTAAQLFDAARRAKPDLVPALADGNFAPLREWLRENIHARGCFRSRDELIADATGRTLDPEMFRRHLVARYCS